MKEDIDHGFQSKNKHCTCEIHIAYNMGQLLSIAITVILKKLQKKASDYHAGMERGQNKGKRGQYRVGEEEKDQTSQQRQLLSSLSKYTNWG